MRILVVLACGLGLAACGCPTRLATPGDAGAGTDGGTFDAGDLPDASTSDAGLTDAGLPDAGAAICPEFGSIDIWAPVDAGIALPGDLGRILACEHLGSFSQVALAANPLVAGQTVRNGYELYALQYVSEGPVGVPHRVSALLYAPSGGPAGVPLVAVNHGTTGMGPNCGPTHLPAYTDYMALPIVAHGYAAVATDYTNMGVDEGGVAPYLVGTAEGLDILDAVRAAFHFHDSRFDADQLSGELFFAGHSQGGQATLFAHQLYDPSVGGTLLGSVSWAPALGDPREMGQILSSGTPTLGVGTFLVMGLYGNMSYYGEPDAGSWLLPGPEAQLPGILHDDCFVDGATALSTLWPTLGQILTPSFLAAAQGCDFDAGTCPALGPWTGELLGDVPGSFTSDAPALLVQGESDTLVLPETTACIAARLQAHGTPEQACGYALADHLTIVGRSVADTLAWMDGRREGKTADVCPAPLSESCAP